MRNLVTALVMAGGLAGNCQTEYPQDDFIAPIGIDMYLAGNFAELRSNHFHTGIDIKTNKTEGYKIYACADGYVSRIKVSLWGYGNVIYVDHPNGYTTVYAHLQGFNEEIDAFIKEVQYYKQDHEVEIYPGKDALPVSQGDVIAYSGNSGSSSAPHVHFEIRDTESEEPINPLLFGFDIKDDIPPEASQIRIYPMDTESYVNGTNMAQTFNLSGSNGNYTYAGGTIKVHGNIGLAINSIDKLSGMTNKCGIYDVALKVDGEMVFGQRMERLDFSTNRHINCHMDYALYKSEKASFHKSHVAPNNQLPIYRDLVNDGVLTFDDDEVHSIEYTIMDAYGNTTKVQFTLQSSSTADSFSEPGHTELWRWNEDNSYSTGDVTVYMPSGSLYEDLLFRYELGEQPSGTYSPIHWIHDEWTGVQNYYTVKIHVGEIDEEHQDKLLVVEAWEKGSSYGYSALDGTYDDGWVTTRTRDLGGYTVMIDTVAPVITPQNVYEGANLTKQGYIEFKMADNLSGIEEYDGYIDGEWVLFEYDPKTSRVRYTDDPDRSLLDGGIHELRFVVEDERGNVAEYTCTITW